MNDTEWIAGRPVQGHERMTYWSREAPHLRTRMLRGYRGVVRRIHDGKVETDSCPHIHRKSSVAQRCAESAAKRWNRLEARAPRAFDEGDES